MTPGRVPRWLPITGVWLLIGVFVWGQGVLSSFIRYPEEEIDVWQRLAYTLTGWGFWIPVTYLVLRLSQAWPVERATLRRSISRHLAVALAIAVIHAPFQMLLVVFIEQETIPFWRTAYGYFTFSAHLDVITYFAILAVTHAISSSGKLHERERTAAALRASLATAQLESLRMQLQPHFLFNTLQAISTLVDENPAAARRTISRLGDLLRTSLDKGQRQEVSLREELETLDTYLDIVRTRFPDRLNVTVAVPDEALAVAVPGMILQPLVENSVRHAIEPRSGRGMITVTARRERDDLVLAVADDGPGFPTTPSASGIGLTNSRERMERLHGPGSFQLGNGAGGGAVATLRMPWRIVSD